MVTQEKKQSGTSDERSPESNQVAERPLRKDEDSTAVASRPEVVVVTGATAGLGRAIVRAFAREGAHIGLLARGHDRLEGARRDVEVPPIRVDGAAWIRLLGRTTSAGNSSHLFA